MLSTNHVKPRAWSVGLSWSHDALRAAAFNLTHGFMAEIGEALASDPDYAPGVRSDMTPADVGQTFRDGGSSKESDGGSAYGAPLMRDQGYIPTLIFCKIYVIPLGPGTVP